MSCLISFEAEYASEKSQKIYPIPPDHILAKHFHALTKI